MPGTSKDKASDTVELGGYEGHFEKVEDYTIAFETYTADADFSPFFDGLPNNQCQSPHWGYVIKGKVTYKFGDREETYETGDAYYIPPGHTPKIYEGSEVVEFSPTKELQRTIDVVSKNLEKAAS